MKAIKIIVTVLIIIIVLFFGTGLVVKESSYSVEVSIDKPLSETFAKFNDMSSMKEWIPEFDSVETVDLKEGITGSIYNITVDNNGEKIVMREKVLAYVKDEKVALYFDMEGVIKTDDFTFKRDGSKTIIVLNSSYQAESYIYGCVLPYMKGVFKGVDQKNLDRFKAFIEKQ